MVTKQLLSLHRLVWTALMAASICAGAFLIIPIGPVPVSMQPFFVFLAGYCLGPVHGAASVALYVLAGVAGLPVFAGGQAGLGHLLGPTGGYLVGFIASAGLTGMAQPGRNLPMAWVPGLLWGLAALVAAYGLGALWLAHVLDFGWVKALAVGVVPFIPWDVIKVVAAIACCRSLSRYRLLP